MRRGVLAVAGLAMLVAAPAAHAQQATPYGGGTMAPLEVKKAYHPTMGVTIQPTAAGRTVFIDTALRCSDGFVDFVKDSGKVASAGPHFDFTGSGRTALVHGSIRFKWTMSADVGAQAATGTVTITGRERYRGRLHACKAKPKRAFTALVENPPGGAPSGPRAGGAYYGLSSLTVGPGLRAPVIIRVAANGRKAQARWTFAPHCRDGGSVGFNSNFSDIGKIGADGSFANNERFTVRLHDALIRFRAAFSGRFTTDGASGTLRLRARVFDPHGRHLISTCDTGRGSWSALAPG